MILIRYFIIFIILSVLFVSSLLAQDGKINFTHLTIKNGLSDGRIDCILQDSDGFLWIGTDGGGLNKFSRQKGVCVHFKFEKNNPLSISNNQVTCIFKDREGTF
jgi:ligand-binding sensor domain-containing protein